MDKLYDVIIIGAGQSGIVMSHKLKHKNIKHIMLDASSRIGDSWRFRYKSLVLFTPKKYSSLSGLMMKGNPESYPTKDEMADYLESYVSHFDLPHKLGVKVIKVVKELNHFHIFTADSKRSLIAKQLVIASGAFQEPFIPPIISNFNSNVLHLHSSKYIEPSQLQEGKVLVVGGGNSGAQIAVELAKYREVLFAVSHKMKFLPLRVMGKSIFYWLEKFKLLYAGIDTKRGKWFQNQNDPIFGKEIKEFIVDGNIIQKVRVSQVNGTEVIFEDESREQVNNIIWATGFIPSFKWIDIEGAISDNGQPVQQRGVSCIKGLYFIGLPWQYHRGSALVYGVDRDAEYLSKIMNY